jgi:prepilin-type N-terminal cleavage/methylation domain-containing protein
VTLFVEEGPAGVPRAWRVACSLRSADLIACEVRDGVWIRSGRIAMRRSTAGKSGFTLIELLIVVAIIGIIAALLVPNFIDSLQKAKQKRTMADARNVGNSMMAWLTDQASAAAAGASGTFDTGDWTGITDLAEIQAQLVPTYIQEVPRLDGWKQPFNYTMNITDPEAERLFLITSGGRDANVPSGTYTIGSFDPTDYDQDIIWADGLFLRWPQKEETP